MFDQACSDYFKLRCSVGGGTDSTCKLFGMGCLLTGEIAVTASHVFRSIEGSYAWPVVQKFDGLYRCDIALDFPRHDVMLLRTREKLREADLGSPDRFPSLFRSVMNIGLLVGYLARVRIPAPTGEKGHTYFSHGSVSALLPGDGDTVRAMITGGVIQTGFSGGPVFLPDGELVGVVVEALRFPAELSAPRLTVYNFPVATPLAPLRNEIVRLLA